MSVPNIPLILKFYHITEILNATIKNYTLLIVNIFVHYVMTLYFFKQFLSLELFKEKRKLH